jgi:hypothetical protein
MDECRVSVLNWRIHDRIDFYVRFGKKNGFHDDGFHTNLKKKLLYLFLSKNFRNCNLAKAHFQLNHQIKTNHTIQLYTQQLLREH